MAFKEHYILDIEHRDKAIEIIETLFPGYLTPQEEKAARLTAESTCGLSAFSSDCLQRFYAVTITPQLFFAQFRLCIS